MQPLRADAARSRERILAAARGIASDELRLNDLAREAGLGVGTVYRHFPTVTALLEELHADTLNELVGIARRTAQSASPGSAFVDLVRAGAELQLSCDGLQTVLIADDVSAHTRALRDEFLRFAQSSLQAAIDEGLVRPEMTISAVQRLVCGVEHAVRLGSGADRSLLMDVLVAGLRPQAG
ncbi:TetR/AcrR family transcriptional regulator [Microbacterium suwonense]|uniref:TetR family transcriptional regulator n=1 Tax=Microbacterium suwonense TaxID=683047 RepID=A0ABM8FS79_9MICO|nr:TetR/AcrR family transcriptional regulator [Microbacterium suwonense]BDZ38341.1 TetR family transcriptional regulator [Microbacterium suwonense]